MTNNVLQNGTNGTPLYENTITLDEPRTVYEHTSNPEYENSHMATSEYSSLRPTDAVNPSSVHGGQAGEVSNKIR